MKSKFTFVIIIVISVMAIHAQAQNTFPITGRVGIYTTSPATSLQVKGGARFGTASSYVNIDSATGNLSFAGTSGYQVGGNKYAFQYSGNSNYGLFFNSTNVQYEFRNGSAVPIFSVNANTGNGVFNGTLKIGAYTLPSTDGINGQVLTTNGSGAVSWAAGSGGSSPWTTSGSNIYNSNTGNVGIGTTTPATKLAVQIAGSGYPIQSTNGTVDVRTYQNTTIGQIGTYNNYPFQLMANNGINQLVLLPNGNVGIGNATPAALLDVNGDALVHGVSVGYGTDTSNTIFGRHALASFTSSLFEGENTAIGNNALNANTNGPYNTATGYDALVVNTTGTSNTATGHASLLGNTTGDYNTADGDLVLGSTTTGGSNTGVGYLALTLTSTGSNNTAVGAGALELNKTGSNNTALGYLSGVPSTLPGLTNAMVLGYNASVNASNKVVVGNTSVTVIGGQVGFSTFSDGRFKKDIQPNVPGLAFINKLKPVTYHVELEKFEQFLGRKDSALQAMKPELQQAEQKLRTGFIAQEVEQAAKDVKYDFDGVNHPQNDKDNYSLVYADFVPSLVKAVQELSKQNDSLKTQNQQLSTRLDKIETMLSQQSNAAIITNATVNKQTIELSGTATLGQNIPNPFSSSTTISYYLPVNNGHAFLNFYNEQGVILKTVTLSGNGNGTITLKADELPSGVYRYTLSADGKLIDSKQMEKLK